MVEEAEMSHLKVWVCWANSNKYLSLETFGFEDVLAMFNGCQIRDWQIPEIQVTGKSKKLGDFINWSHDVPVFQEKVCELMSPILGDYVQFLPLGKIRKRNIFAVNVLCSLPCLDRDTSVLLPSGNRMIAVPPYSFVEGFQTDIPIFKADDSLGEVFVGQAFADIVIRHQLRGVYLADPYISQIGKIMQRQSLNVVPGVPE